MKKENYLKKELYGLIKNDDQIFNFIQDAALDGLWYWDLENKENEWMNDQFWTTLGYDPEKMPHKAESWQKIINPDDLKVAMEKVQSHLENPDEPYSQYIRYKHKNGSTVWIECKGIAIRDESGRPVRMLGAHHDITVLKETEKKLEAEINKNKTWIQNSPICTKILDTDFNIHFMSDAGISQLEIDDMSQYYGKPYPFEFYPESFKKEMRKNLQTAKSTGKTIRQEAPVNNINRQKVWYESTIVPVYTDDNVLDYIMVVSQDTTERREAEEKLKTEKKRVEESNRLKTEFLHNMSHEIRTPMNSLTGFCKLLG